MPKVKRIHHVAVVVDDMEKSLSFWRDALGRTCPRSVTCPNKNPRWPSYPGAKARSSWSNRPATIRALLGI